MQLVNREARGKGRLAGVEELVGLKDFDGHGHSRMGGETLRAWFELANPPTCSISRKSSPREGIDERQRSCSNGWAVGKAASLKQE